MANMSKIIARIQELSAAKFILLVALALPASASTVIIDTRNSPNYSPWLGGWGSIGQTFIAPSELMLNTSMWTSRWAGGAADVEFIATLRAWNGTAPVGDALFTSAIQHATETTATEYHFDFGDGIPLTVDESYVFYFSTSSGGLINSHTADPNFQSTYANGGTVGGFNPGSLPTNSFSAVDNVFVASFQGVPEPSRMFFLLSGILALMCRRRRAGA